MSHTNETSGSAGTRRDFLYYATAGAGAVATGAAVWPLVNQMNPSADVHALASIFVDVSSVEPGTQLTVKWLGKPVFIRRRTPEDIESARAVALTELPDINSENANKPATDASDQNRTLDEAGEWAAAWPLIVVPALGLLLLRRANVSWPNREGAASGEIFRRQAPSRSGGDPRAPPTADAGPVAGDGRGDAAPRRRHGEPVHPALAASRTGAIRGLSRKPPPEQVVVLSTGELRGGVSRPSRSLVLAKHRHSRCSYSL